MQATLCENLQVEIVSQRFCSSADNVAIMAVRQFPPTYHRHVCTIRKSWVSCKSHSYTIVVMLLAYSYRCTVVC